MCSINIDSPAAKLDRAYLEAVENGDMETAQKMVDEAAKVKGYTIKAYHGTNAEFNAFDKERVGKAMINTAQDSILQLKKKRRPITENVLSMLR